MQYIKLFENYMYGDDQLYINDIMVYLGVDTTPQDEKYVPTSVYGIDVIGYFKEVFLDKYIIFNSVNSLKNDPVTFGVVEDVDYYSYKDTVYITVKLYGDSDSYLIQNNYATFVKKYDADTKPLHKEAEMKKMSYKYNI